MVNCDEQSCEFFNMDWTNYIKLNTQDLFTCKIKSSKVFIGNINVTINTNNNEYSNIFVKAVNFDQEKIVMEFIPNCIFQTFAYLEILRVHATDFKTLTPNDLENAGELRSLWIFGNKQFNNLEANLFVAAPNLEHIDLTNNNIENIHRKTFSGLKKLQVLQLFENKIKILHSTTFSHLISLTLLDLDYNECVSNSFKNINQHFTEVEATINKSSCLYYMNYELVSIDDQLNDNQKSINIILLNANKQLKLSVIEQQSSLKLLNDKIESERKRFEDKIRMMTQILNDNAKKSKAQIKEIMAAVDLISSKPVGRDTQTCETNILKLDKIESESIAGIANFLKDSKTDKTDDNNLKKMQKDFEDAMNDEFAKYKTEIELQLKQQNSIFQETMLKTTYDASS